MRRSDPTDPLASRPERSGEQGGSGKRVRRRKLLGKAFLAALTLFLAVNLLLPLAGKPLARLPQPSRWLATSLTSAVDWYTGANQPMVFRRGPVRWLANAVRGPVRIGLQVGHLNAADQPDELASLRFNTGGFYDGLAEVSINETFVAALATRLSDRGAIVDVIPATVPPGYSADVFISVHADSNLDTSREGYKSAHFWPPRNQFEALLKLHVDRAVFAGTPLRDDDSNASGNMLHYYAFNHFAFRHSVARRTPALLIELGYLSNPRDRRLLLDQELLLDAVESGISSYLVRVGRVPASW